MITATRESDPFGFTSAPQLSGPGASTKQIKFIIKLGLERGVDLADAIAEVNPDGSLKLDQDGEATPKITKRDASAKIEVLLKSKATLPVIPIVPTAPVPAVELEAGMYRADLGTGYGFEFFKVQKAVHGSGKMYAKVLVIDSDAVRNENNKIVRPAKCHFEYAPGAIRKLTPEDKLSLEDAKEFGALYGNCCACARDLTDEDSIYNGFGRKCASNNGWVYEKAPKVHLDK